MDEFGYFVFVFAPLLAAILGGGAWLLQAHANRNIDAVINGAAAVGREQQTLAGQGSVSDERQIEMVVDQQQTGGTTQAKSSAAYG